MPSKPNQPGQPQSGNPKPGQQQKPGQNPGGKPGGKPNQPGNPGK